jgi:tetratricopeptide (TPR) repeat protein
MPIKRKTVAKAVLIVGMLLLIGGLLSQLWLRNYDQNRKLQHWSSRHTEATKRLSQATTDGESFYPLTELAKSALYLGHTNEARGHAQRLLAMAPQFQDSWNYGNAIHDGNEVLGQIAVQEGRIEDAKRHLLAAGQTPGSPQLDNFGPDMWLAQDLLKKGDRETVLEYLQLCRKFWKRHGDLLDKWTQAIQAGKTPDLEDRSP